MSVGGCVDGVYWCAYGTARGEHTYIYMYGGLANVKRLVKYAWEHTEGKGKPIAATLEEWAKKPGTAQSLMGGNVATHEGTTCQVRPRAGWGCTGGGVEWCTGVHMVLVEGSTHTYIFMEDWLT